MRKWLWFVGSLAALLGLPSCICSEASIVADAGNTAMSKATKLPNARANGLPAVVWIKHLKIGMLTALTLSPNARFANIGSCFPSLPWWKDTPPKEYVEALAL